jgi:hypothetical protein
MRVFITNNTTDGYFYHYDPGESKISQLKAGKSHRGALIVKSADLTDQLDREFAPDCFVALESLDRACVC